eukprot:TRINITY_DN50903_c0_g1_i1.p1 TRINITY_DN50903_c0_g1~~TRINITY_DN50903_c0_g1_i1.p1  ORF type:complete len:300 (-),score=73.04 TRINITY_DN50903_c0_g1_i1:66-965(-)
MKHAPTSQRRKTSGSAVRQVVRKEKLKMVGGVHKNLQSKGIAKRKPPATWRAHYPIIKALRTIRDAPVDTVGCERLADPKASKKDFEWQCLVAAMLSSQTKDQANADAMENLRKHGNTVESIARTPEKKIDRLIAKVGFHAVKAKNLKAAAKICQAQHGGRVPSTLEGLMALPGVGPKMAHLTLHAAFDAQEGICVDTHVHRIANALKWISTKTPEETRIALESWLPAEEWADINVLLVGLGQQQQQQQGRLIEHCLNCPSPAAALQLVVRIGLSVRPGKFEALDNAAKMDPAIRRLLS